MATKLRIGILALQGDFADHSRHFRKLKVDPILLRRRADLSHLSALVIPGGESSTMHHLLETHALWDPLLQLLKKGLPVLGTCAGAILLAKKVAPTSQPCFGIADIHIVRNAYGRQKESFETKLSVPAFGKGLLPAVFIRAPRIVHWDSQLEVLASLEGSPVMIKQKTCLLTTFHSELTEDLRVHRYFLEHCLS